MGHMPSEKYTSAHYHESIGPNTWWFQNWTVLATFKLGHFKDWIIFNLDHFKTWRFWNWTTFKLNHFEMGQFQNWATFKLDDF